MSVTPRNTHRRPRPASVRGTRVMAMAVTGSLSAATLVLAAGSAAADATPNSQAEGRFLDGRSGGVNLDSLANLAPAQAENNGGATVTEVNPLTATVLNSVVVPIGPISLLGANGILDLGAVNQVAIARANGSSVGASGAVTNDGAIDVGGSSAFPGDATLDLGGLLPGTGILDDLDLSVGALSARATQAAGAHGNQDSTYQIADLELRLDSTVLSGLLAPLFAQQSEIAGLPALLNGIAPVGGVVSIGALPDIEALFADIVGPDGTLSSGLLSVNFTNGVLTVDLGGSLNNLPPNTPVLTAIVAALGGLETLVEDAVEELQADVEAALRDVPVLVALPDLVGGGVLPAIPLVGAGGVIETVIAGLDLIPSATTTGQLDNGIVGLLSDVLALTANVQDEPPNTQKPAGSGIVDEFTVTALRVNVLDSTAVVNLASASVGSNFGPQAVAPPIDLGAPVITDPEDGDETEDTTPPISGVGAPGATVTVREGSTVICTAVVRANRTWTCTPTDALSLGSHTITARQTLNGRTSDTSAPVTFRIVDRDGNVGGEGNGTGSNGAGNGGGYSGNLPNTGGFDPLPFGVAGLALLLTGAAMAAAQRRALKA